jgi:ABC-type dipeptide/oligopeptide/nickel transport system permease subunit
MCVAFHGPICVSDNCTNGAAFLSGELRPFIGFSAWTDRASRVRGSIMLQRRKDFFLSANVANS